MCNWNFDETSSATRRGLALPYYRKRGSASYIVREVLSVREREIQTERERRKWRHHCRAKIGDEFTLSLAKNSRNFRWAYTFPCQKFALFASPFTERSPLSLENASIVGRALDGTLRFRRWKRSRALSRRCHRSRLLAKQCTVTQWSQRPVERRRNGGVAQGSNSSASTLRIRFLALVVFSVLSRTFSEHCTKKSVDQRPPEVESGISGANRRFLVCERRVKKDRTLVGNIQIDCVSMGRWTRDAVCEETKNRALAQAFFREEIIVNQSQKKARSKYGICAGFWFDRRRHKAKRSDARFIYILIPKTIGNRKRDCAWGGSGW